MAETNKIVRQWLETDATLGVDEVPIASRKKPASIARAAIRPQTAPSPAAPLPAPVARPAASAPRAPAPASPAPSKKPSAPPQNLLVGNIADLPRLTRAQKQAELQALLEQLERESAPYINDISTRVVFGEGDPDAQLMFVGEGPGAEEDRTGRPFVGRSGQLLDKMIAAIGLKREQVYIGNVVKLRCADWADGAYGRRLQDRPPTPEEAARGLPFLHRQIEIIHPKVIVTLGAPALKHLTGTTEGVMKIRGTWLQYRGIPVMPTYHPSFVLRAYTEENRRKVWSDLKEALKRVQETKDS